MTYLFSVASKTRPNNTTQYTAGDVINEDASAGTGWSFVGVARNGGQSGRIVRARVEDSANQSTKAQLELWLYTAAPTADNDNAAFTPSDAENNSYVCAIPLPYSYVGDATSGAGGNCIYDSDRISIPFTCAAADNGLYGVLVVRNAYTPVAQETFRIQLTTEVE